MGGAYAALGPTHDFSALSLALLVYETRNTNMHCSGHSTDGKVVVYLCGKRKDASGIMMLDQLRFHKTWHNKANVVSVDQ